MTSSDSRIKQSSKARWMLRHNIPQMLQNSYFDLEVGLVWLLTSSVINHKISPPNFFRAQPKKILISQFHCRATQTEANLRHSSSSSQWEISQSTACRVCMFSKLIKHAFSTAVHETLPIEEPLLNSLVCMKFTGLWLQILKPIIEIAATVSGRASVSRTRGRSISDGHNRMFPSVFKVTCLHHFKIKSVVLSFEFWD